MELKQGLDIRECKVCKQPKARIYVKKFNNGKDKKFVDDKGGQWNGKMCPECHLHIVKISKRNKISES